MRLANRESGLFSRLINPGRSVPLLVAFQTLLCFEVVPQDAYAQFACIEASASPRGADRGDLSTRGAVPVAGPVHMPIALNGSIGGNQGGLRSNIDNPGPLYPSAYHPFKFVAMSAFVAGAATGIFAYESDLWWDVPPGRFHWYDEWGYAHNFDKLGHFFGTYAYGLTITRLYDATGMKPRTAALIGSAIGFAIQLHVEIWDGFHERFGFDRGDLAANALGAGWFYAQERWPELQRVEIRWSFNPLGVPDTGLTKNFTEDYVGHGYWASLRFADLLPAQAQRFWPSWLRVSFGAVRRNDGRIPEDPYYVAYYISVDPDFRRIFPRGSWWGRALGDVLSLFRWPAPALRLGPEPGFNLFFYGQ
jgi:hypothetical protein